MKDMKLQKQYMRNKINNNNNINNETYVIV